MYYSTKFEYRKHPTINSTRARPDKVGAEKQQSALTFSSLKNERHMGSRQVIYAASVRYK